MNGLDVRLWECERAVERLRKELADLAARLNTLENKVKQLGG